MRYVVVAIILVGAMACAPEDNSPVGRYRAAVVDATETSTLTDPAAPLGLSLGMTRDEYFDHCTQLNRQQLITMGRGGTAADHYLEHELDRPAIMTFRPVFGEDPKRLEVVELEFTYQDWSPWNQSAFADKLLPDAAEYLGRLLDLTLTQLDHPLYGTVYTGVSGGRHVALWRHDDSTVRAGVSDLTALGRDPLGLVQ